MSDLFDAIIGTIAIALGIAILSLFLGSEKEGYINYDDCREVINIKDDSLRTWVFDFTCDYSNECVDTSNYAFSSKCETAYRYWRDEK
jgi:hypothetical protein